MTRSLVVVCVLATALPACAASRPAPACTQVDLGRTTPSLMPAPVTVAHRRQLVTAVLDPPSLGVAPILTADAVWPKLYGSLRPGGGGEHELLLGLMTSPPVISRQLLWVLVTHRHAELLALQTLPPNVKDLTGPCCEFFDVVTAVNATTGEVIHGSTSASPR